MRVKIDVESLSLSPSAQAATRGFVLSELHRVVYGYALWVDSIEVQVNRLGEGSARPWRIEACVALTRGDSFRVGAQRPHPHTAIDEVVRGVWERLHEACPPASKPMPPIPQVA